MVNWRTEWENTHLELGSEATWLGLDNSGKLDFNI